MPSADALAQDQCVIRRTHQVRGRSQAVTPANSASRFLHYGRIVLSADDAPLRFDTRTHETAFIVLGGTAHITSPQATRSMTRYDALYVPRGTTVAVAPGPEGCDVAEISAPVEGTYPEHFVRFADVQTDPGLHFTAGGPGTQRHLNILIGKNVEAGRLMAGVTFSAPGNWTSWPPHEHAVLAEEAYLYIDMPAPAWGVQLVYTNPADPELAVVVREGDCVLMPKGYHPNVAAPGHSINFLWMMAATREREDRRFGVVNVQPEYAEGGSGLEKGR